MIKYRPEIDGLRFIAVIAVVLYHANIVIPGGNQLHINQFDLKFFKGGFIGVDIFFVISGYLICYFILKGIKQNNFSFSNFYERRARRLLPVLYLIIFISIPIAVIFMHPDQLIELSGSILSSLGFGSNIWFWLEDSYTAQQSQLKPFLHTWSLSIEEQFYFIFPPLVIFIHRFFRKHLLIFLIVLFFISLICAQITSSRYTDASFYLIHTRAWELIAGSILAVIELDYGRRNNKYLSKFMPIVGLLIILYSLLFFDDQMFHPSFVTLLPIVGTMILIWYSGHGGVISNMLSTKLFVGGGLISYGLYLWHFPIFAFSKILNFEQTALLKILIIFISVILSIVTYIYIERPTRNRNFIKSKYIISFLSIIFLILSISSGYIYVESKKSIRNLSLNGVSYNVEYEKNKRFSYLHEICPEIGWSNCRNVQNGKVNVMVVGDSMAIDAVNIIEPLYPEYHYIVDDEFGGCPPHPNIIEILPQDHPYLAECINKNKERFNKNNLLGVDVIVINLLYNWYKPKNLIPYLEFLKSNNFHNVLIFGNYISLKENFYNHMTQNKSLSESSSDRDIKNIIDKKFYLQNNLEIIADKYEYNFVNLKENICPDVCPIFIKNYPYTWDKFHFSKEFSGYISQLLRDELSPIFSGIQK